MVLFSDRLHVSRGYSYSLGRCPMCDGTMLLVIEFKAVGKRAAALFSAIELLQSRKMRGYYTDSHLGIGAAQRGAAASLFKNHSTQSENQTPFCKHFRN